MKKISFLLVGMLLLFPIAIYVGNLTDVPASKKIIVYLRDLVGMSASKEVVEKIPSSYAHIGLVESWRNLGAGSMTDLLQLVATPASHDAWRTTTGDFPGNSLHSAAFFSSSWSFWQTQQEKLSLIGYYQPWINVLLLIQVVKVEEGYKAVAIGIMKPDSTDFPTTPIAMTQTLTARLQQAEQAFRTVAQNPDITGRMLDATVVKKSQDALNQYVTDLRSKLATSTSKNPTDIRLPVLEWLDTVQAGQIKEIQELAQPSTEWLKQLQIVQLLKLDTENWLLTASDRNQPERVLLAQLHIIGHKVQASEFQIWDAASAGESQ